MGSWKDRGNQYIQFVRVLYSKLPTNGKQLPAFPLDFVYLGFYVAFNTVQVISRRVVGRAEETST